MSKGDKKIPRYLIYFTPTARIDQLASCTVEWMS